MGIAAIVLAVVATSLAFLLLDEMRKRRLVIDTYDKDTKSLSSEIDRRDAKIAQLEAEIVRLRKIPAEIPKQVDNSIIKARSASQVRQITESAWGTKPEIGEA